MKTKTQTHTPGPWEYDAMGLRAHNGEWFDIARWTTGNSPADSAQGDANARLIAAAPELLEAVKAALMIAEDLDAKGQYIDYPRGMAFDGSFSGGLRAALAKAEGREAK